MAPSGSLCRYGRRKLAQMSLWQVAHWRLMSAGLRATRPSGPFLWMAWQLTQLTWFLAWLLLMRPTWVGWLRWAGVGGRVGGWLVGGGGKGGGTRPRPRSVGPVGKCGGRGPIPSAFPAT